MSARAEYWQAPNGRWYFHRRAANGKITDQSQGYTLRQNAKRAIRQRWPGLPIIFRGSFLVPRSR